LAPKITKGRFDLGPMLEGFNEKMLKTMNEEEGMHEQSGFRANRGTIGRQKRKEHNLETWVMFVDLVKAFDIVPREVLTAALRRYGLPNHFVSIVIRLQKNAKIKVKIGSVDSEIESSIGVRQGSCKGPVLFLIIMQAAFDIMIWPVPKLEFGTRGNGVTWVNVQNGNEEQPSLYIAVHCALMRRYCSFTRETI
jgi:hypothetical protein